MRRFWSVTNVSLAHAIKIFPEGRDNSFELQEWPS